MAKTPKLSIAVDASTLADGELEELRKLFEERAKREPSDKWESVLDDIVEIISLRGKGLGCVDE